MAGTHFKGPLVHGPQSTNVNKYAYRQNLGMMPSAEFNVFHDDFVAPVTSNQVPGWDPTDIIDTGATITTVTTATAGASGVLSLNDATASEGAAFHGAKAFQLVSGKKFFLEALIRTSDVTDNDFQIGLSALNAVTNPEDLYTTASTDLIAFGILDGSATLKMLADLSNSGSTAETADTTLGTLTAATWHTIAIAYDGGTGLTGWLDGNKCLTWAQTFASTVPLSVALAPFVAARNGDGAGNNTNWIDYFRIVQER